MTETDRSGGEVTAVILSHGDKRNLRRCLRALCSGSIVPQLLVVDTGTGDCGEMVKKDFPQAVLLQNESYAGYCNGVNCGLHLVRTPWALVIRPEIEVGTDALLRLCEAAADSRIRADKLLGAQGAEDLLLVRMTALEEIGYLDERLYDGCEVSDLVWRGEFCGLHTVPVRDCDVTRHRRIAVDEADRQRRLVFRRKIEAGNLIYMKYKYLSSALLSAAAPMLALRIRAMKRSFVRHGLSQDWEAAMMRAQELCIAAEEELMEREEGMSVTKQPLPDEFCIGVSDERVNRIYPLYVDERMGTDFRDLPSVLRIQSRIVNKFR